VKTARIVVLSVLLASLLLGLVACGSSGPAGVSNLTLSSDKAGTDKKTTFAPKDTIYLSADVNKVADGTKFEVKWFALNVKGQDPNAPFLTNDVTWKSGAQNNLTASADVKDTGFPVGKYRVEVDMGGKKAAERPFEVQ
jgi:hypothetical protein